MRRPLCAAALVYCLAVLALLQLMPPQTEDFSAYDREMVTVLGTVTGKEYKTSEDGSVKLLVTLKNVEADGWEEQPSYRVLCRVGDGTQEGAEAADALLRIGAPARIRGKLYVYAQATNAGEFDSQLYYQILGYTSFQLQSAEIEAVGTGGSALDNALYQVKRFLAGNLEACLDEEDAQILKAMLLGEKGSLTAEVKDLYQGSGIIHILAISGLHISIIGMGLFRLLRLIAIPLPARLSSGADRVRRGARSAGREGGAGAPPSGGGRTGRSGSAPNPGPAEGKKILSIPLPAAALAAVLVMLLYGRMTGMSASSFRAIVMFLLRMLAAVRRRTYDLPTGIALAGLLLLIQQPLYLYHTGFLFSFSAVLGIALLAPAFHSKIMKTLSVTLGTLPVQLTCYGTFPLYSVLLNLVVLPLMSTVMVSGLAVLALGSLFLPAGRAIGTIPHVILLFYKAVCTFTGTLAGHQINVGAPAVWQLAVYLGILAAIALTKDRLEEWRRRRKRESAGTVPPEGALRGILRRHDNFLPELLRILAAAAAVFILCLRVHTGLSLHVIDVGQGDGMLIRCEGVNLLIDGGSTSKTSLGEYQLTPLLEYYGVRKLDYVIITHPDQDHISGALEVLEQSRTHQSGWQGILLDDSENGITVGTLCLPSAAASSQNDNYASLLAAAQEKNIPVVYLKEGDVLEGEDLRLVCLHPEADSSYDDANEMSVTLWLEYGAFTALLTGDLEGEGEERMLEYLTEGEGCSLIAGTSAKEGSGDSAAEGDEESAGSGDRDAIEVTLLKVAHHGSSGATSEEFLELFRPQLAVISCGVNNSYGHPHSETLERLSAAGVETIYDTRTGGEITFHTDGKTLRITQHGGAME